MKLLVTGVSGQLGHDVMNELWIRGLEGIGSDLASAYSGAADGSPVAQMPYVPMDITDEGAVRAVMSEVRPDAVIHCAAWTAVDAAEEPENQAKVMAVNVDGTRNIAALCAQYSAKMLYLSTDYVFGGEGEEPWEPDCQEYAPLNVYGRSKLAGEQALAGLLREFFVVRTAWVFGASGNNFVRTMLKIGKNHDQIRVVNDQIGTPTYTYDLARLLVDMVGTDRYGYYHATNEGGYISWYEFSKEIFRQAAEFGHEEYGKERLTVIPVSSSEYQGAGAARPFNSRLDRTKLVREGFCPLPRWGDAVRRYLETGIDFAAL